MYCYLSSRTYAGLTSRLVHLLYISSPSNLVFFLFIRLVKLMGSERDACPLAEMPQASMAKIKPWWHGQLLHQEKPQRMFISVSG